MEKREQESFSYTYSAEMQEEVRAIRQKYTDPQPVENKMARLRQLDASVTQRATVVSLVLGIIGALILGTGMSLVMTNLGELLGLHEKTNLLLGIFVGIVGIVLISLAYPTYNHILKKERKRIAPEIIRLSGELMK
ncbi:MAG: hypothetical protein J6L87_05075 [Clostridia bacterium]|nr:hypothetical protein [Clostridia bacterium]